MTGWATHMARALEVARRAPATGDIPVGALVLDGDRQVISEGCNERERTQDPTAHAEILAIRRAAERYGSWRLDDHTLVVTLEPCVMCAGAIAAARIERIVFGAYDPKAGAIASLFDVVRDPRLPHRPAVVGGIAAEECGRVLQGFFDLLR